MAQEWDIKARSEQCGSCSKPFADQEVYASVLVFGEDGYRRADYCTQCRDAAQASDRLFSTWQGIYRLPPPPPEEPLKKENAETLLRKLIEGEDPGHANVVFILAVMLERKRILVERAVQQDSEDRTIRVYEHRKTGETFLIHDPHLGLQQLHAVQEQVIRMLGGDPASAGGATAPAAGSPAPAAPEPQPAPAG